MGKLVEFLAPSKFKISVALLLPAFWAVAMFLAGKIYLGLFKIEAFPVTPFYKFELLPILLFIIGYLVQSLLYYPFACSIIAIFDSYRKDELRLLKKDKVLVTLILLGLAFNPVALIIILYTPFLAINAIRPPEGVYVLEVLPDSPIGDRGKWLVGKIIVEVNGNKIRNIDDMLEFLDEFEPGEWLRIRTRGGSSGAVNPSKHPSLERAYLGIRVRDNQGRELVL